jgi:methylenetetrahydrofolate dehydrogenase (NADP+)/methenyltetrahydrofolate cyclohydrolase
MIINGKELGETILNHLKKEIDEGVKNGLPRPHLVIFSVKPGSETESFMKNKKKAAEYIGAQFELVLYSQPPRFETFAKHISTLSHTPEVHGIVIQEPLPSSLSTVTLFDYIPILKEIEGFKKKSPYDSPIGLAVLTAIKQAYGQGDMSNIDNILINMSRDVIFFKNIVKRKKVVLLGRGKTGGAPIGELLRKAKIGHINLNSQTKNIADSFLQQADIIITAVGKEVITSDMIKPGAVLISVGMKKTSGV